MLVAVTGASGFVGARLVGRLLDAGRDVRVLRHRGSVAFADDVEIVDGGLDDARALHRLTNGADAVVHVGGLVAARREADFHRVNTEGTRRLAEAAAAAGVSRFLLISSLAARQPDISAYAASKRAAEAAVAEQPDLAWDALRPPAIYGPGDRQVLIFFQLLKRGIGLLPAGEAARVSLIHVDDLVEAVLSWLAASGASGSVYELADSENRGYTWRALIDAAARELTVEPRYISPSPALLRFVGHVSRLWGRIGGGVPFLTPDKVRELRHSDWVCRDDRFRRLTGWRPQIPLGEGLRETVTWYRARGWL
ncbi:NAD-dependent epimerase/dehydratase family protein [Ferruginivarius sediminum]|uniref:NAD-dependent epimerase/dehydratase family protein n=1 Tax=Ferruginivarius sediminum TaxID=2661937 RepID=A0A369T8Y9_9PROT|nr:NAD-dependent epimerase/dehydratase family protein [Ferruginivarius sediminum]RDD60835.1 NAD-dependent epimerase/dehydratase family protein [Ferruginivarius sediminum]